MGASRPAIRIRAMTPADRETWARMRHALWPQLPVDGHLNDITRMLADQPRSGYLALADDAPAGFAEFSIRPYANGCTRQPVPFLEGIWVEPRWRRLGVARALVWRLAADLASEGHVEICSDADLENLVSHAAHGAWGFAETERVVYFRRSLPRR